MTESMEVLSPGRFNDFVAEQPLVLSPEELQRRYNQQLAEFHKQQSPERSTAPRIRSIADYLPTEALLG